jgi:serine/threonine-protein kinase
LPASEDELWKAAALIDRAAAAGWARQDWAYPYSLFAKGLAEYRRGRLDGAIWVMKGEASRVMGPAPGLVLAMAQHRDGQKEAARKTLAAAVLAFDWSAARADERDSWIHHVLRREAEALILPNLQSLLQGSCRPRDNDERVALLGVCQFKDRRLAAARLYADAFAADPKLAEDLRAESRYRAAGCAALAGCGRGADGAELGEAERARWRKQARTWLRADLAVLATKLAGGVAADRFLVQKTLSRWRTDPDLAGLRDPEALDRLPPDERQECAALWGNIDALLKRARDRK